MTAAQVISIVTQVLPKVSSFEAGSPITIAIPTESTTVDLSAEGLGKVEITESGLSITVKKA